jgi:hypothetical protein
MGAFFLFALCFPKVLLSLVPGCTGSHNANGD